MNLAFFREAQAITTNESLKRTTEIAAAEEEKRSRIADDRQSQMQKDGAKRKLDRTITLPTPSNDFNV